MKLKYSLPGLAAFGIITLALPAFAYTGEDLAKNAQVSMATAREIALKAQAGEITDQELEAEAGGSGLRYSFDIKAEKTVYEVGIDAKTGDVLENKAEGSNPD